VGKALPADQLQDRGRAVAGFVSVKGMQTTEIRIFEAVSTGLCAIVAGDVMSAFNFCDLDALARGTPYDALARLRRETPIYWHAVPSSGRGDGFWLVTKHQDICDISRDTTHFYSHDGSVLSDAPPPTAPPALMMVRDGFCHLDAPKHTMYRRLIAPSFAPRAIAALEQRIRARAVQALDRASALRNFEFVREIAASFPVSVVFGDLLGFDPRDYERAEYWGSLFNRVHAIPPTDYEFGPMRGAAVTALNEMHTYARDALRSRRKSPTADILSVLAHLKTSDGQLISEEMFISYFWSLTIAGFDTTASTIAGGVLALNQFPLQCTRLYADPSLVTSAVDEMLRWETPVIYFRRTASADVEIRGQKIKRNQRIVMCYAAGNRDDEVFHNPNLFDIARQPNEHLAFGHGPHFCLGAHVARIEIRVFLEEVLRRQIHFRLSDDVTRTRSNFINRIIRMPATITDS